MKFFQSIKPITYMKKHSAELVNAVTTSRTPIVITQKGEAKVVIQDVKSYEQNQETLLMLKIIALGVEAAEKGQVMDHDKFMKQLEKELNEI